MLSLPPLGAEPVVVVARLGEPSSPISWADVIPPALRYSDASLFLGSQSQVFSHGDECQYRMVETDMNR